MQGCVDALSMALSEQNTIKGITLTGNPKHADCLLISGCINEKSKEEIMQIYEKIPSPKPLLPQACACSGSLFAGREISYILLKMCCLLLRGYVVARPMGQKCLRPLRAMENVKINRQKAKG